MLYMFAWLPQGQFDKVWRKPVFEGLGAIL